MNIDIFNHMVELNTPQLDAVFHALGDATRRQMLRELAQADRTVGELAAPFAISLAAASKHVKALENAGLIRREVRGRTHVCHLNPGPLASANAWLRYYEAFWTVRLDVLDGGGGVVNDLHREDEVEELGAEVLVLGRHGGDAGLRSRAAGERGPRRVLGQTR